MPGSDTTHWLHRFASDEWLAAADTELHRCAETLGRRAFRPGVTHARRATGMAVNAVLTVRPDERYGRSYMDHVAALCVDDEIPPEVRDAARALRDTPPAQPELLSIGKPDLRPLEDARRVVAWARKRVAALAGPPS